MSVLWKILMLTCLADGRCYQQETYIPWPHTHATLEQCLEKLANKPEHNANVDAILPPNTTRQYICARVEQ